MSAGTLATPYPNVTVARYGQFRNIPDPNVVTVSGRVAAPKSGQNAKALSSMVVTPFGTTMLVRNATPQQDSEPIVLTEDGRFYMPMMFYADTSFLPYTVNMVLPFATTYFELYAEPAKVISSRYSDPMNTLPSMDWTLAGSETAVRDVYANAPKSSLDNPSFRETPSNEVHPPKQNLPRVSTDEGMSTDYNEVHPANAPAPIEFNLPPAPNVNEVKLVQLENK